MSLYLVDETISLLRETFSKVSPSDPWPLRNTMSPDDVRNVIQECNSLYHAEGCQEVTLSDITNGYMSR
ncbi:MULTISPECIES: hypothetical protein [Corallincola]|uniref:Uncharacterized protein n=3 Tax=Corallincola TaxID=1775176 RepID=A0A368NKW8_9GAMM|nr:MULTISPECIES: hypothetical protein [Corallincola]RCU49971.1 hypothetical protein DU002_10115 [Corallincola holothuriorum]TAA45051.1 hypothetical protein EXY25_12645 [Corallincola spongiicola]TCI03669.1 hypothetical protein EZV61_08990 [Corallincola luteus]